jgi:DNA-directed RNA polymerase specialized sigma24 family protein
MIIDFENLSDRDIAERLFTQYGNQLLNYGIKSWSLSEDEVWDILYDTIYSFINSYAEHNLSSAKRIEALVWTIFKNKLRDKYRQKKRIERHYQEVAYSEERLSGNTDMQESIWFKYSAQILIEEKSGDPILSKLETILDNLKDWERQLVICRANNIPYADIEEMTGKKADSLKVYYQRLKKRISQDLIENIDKKEKD